MDDALGVRRGQRVGDLDGVGERLRRRQAAVRDGAIERHAVDVLHDDERHVAVLLHAVDGDDVRVVQGGGGAGLVQQPGAGLARRPPRAP